MSIVPLHAFADAVYRFNEDVVTYVVSSTFNLLFVFTYDADISTPFTNPDNVIEPDIVWFVKVCSVDLRVALFLIALILTFPAAPAPYATPSILVWPFDGCLSNVVLFTKYV